jgi:hypothetical protein
VTVTETDLRLRLIDHGGLECPLRRRDGDTWHCRWTNPIFGSSVVHVDVTGGRAKTLRFFVRPEFIDPIEYRFGRD